MQVDSFGCSVMNRFDRLLDDEADPFDILQEAELQKQRKKKKEELKKANAGKQGKKESQKDRRIPYSGDGGLGHMRNNSGLGGEFRGKRGQNENSGLVASGREERRVVFRERRLNQTEDRNYIPVEASLNRWDTGSRRRDWDRRTGERYARNTDSFGEGVKKELNYREQPRDGMTWAPEGNGTEAKGGQEALKPEVRVEDGKAEEEAAEGETVPAVAGEMSLDEWKAMLEECRPKEKLKLRTVDTRVPSKAVVIHKSKPLKEKGITEEYEEYVVRRPANDITASLAYNFGNLPRPGRGGQRRARGARRAGWWWRAS
ncbi:hypothetical protein GJAV_G00026260 [Gymnothorax javanicus]|nr:hypothetical protein GJAV_G00026260 [Gymnothorax javanicus]